MFPSRSVRGGANDAGTESLICGYGMTGSDRAQCATAISMIHMAAVCISSTFCRANIGGWRKASKPGLAPNSPTAWILLSCSGGAHITCSSRVRRRCIRVILVRAYTTTADTAICRVFTSPQSQSNLTLFMSATLLAVEKNNISTMKPSLRPERACSSTRINIEESRATDS